MSKWKTAEFVPPELIDLQDELSRKEHEKLKEKIVSEGHQTFSEVIGALAAELDMALDGAYSHDDICQLCRIITQKLRDRRTPILLMGR